MGLKARYTKWQRDALAALRDSIAHWERMAAGTHGVHEDTGPGCCACCSVFYQGGVPIKACITCPIGIRSGRSHCSGTPYGDAERAFIARRAGYVYHQAALDAEVTYLRETLEMVKRGEITPPEEK